MASGYGVGVFLDNSGLVVVDTDSQIHFGAQTRTNYGWANFQSLCKEVGLPGVPHTFTVQTKSYGHYHFYFRQHPDYPLTRTSIHSQIPQVDVKVTGYVVSWHTKGYSIVRDTDIQRLPNALASRLYRAPVSNVCSESTATGDRPITADYADYLLSGISCTVNGERNITLYKAARTFRDAGLTDAQQRSRLMQAAVNAGLRETEAEQTISSAWR